MTTTDGTGIVITNNTTGTAADKQQAYINYYMQQYLGNQVYNTIFRTPPPVLEEESNPPVSNEVPRGGRMSVTTIEELKTLVVENKLKIPESCLPIEIAQLKSIAGCTKSPLPMLPYSVMGYRKMALNNMKWSVPAFMLFNPWGARKVHFMRAAAMYGSQFGEIQYMGTELIHQLFQNTSRGHYTTKFTGFFPPEVRDFLKEKKAKGEEVLILAEADWKVKELSDYEVDPFIVSLCKGHFHVHKEFNLTTFEKSIKEEHLTPAE